MYNNQLINTAIKLNRYIVTRLPTINVIVNIYSFLSFKLYN